MDPSEIRIVETALQSYRVLNEELAPLGRATLRYVLRWIVLGLLAIPFVMTGSKLVMAGIAVVLATIASFVFAAFSIDCYRYIILGERPSLNLLSDLFGPRQFRLLWQWSLVFLLWLGLCLVPVLGLFLAATVLKGMFAGLVSWLLLGVAGIAAFIWITGFMSRYALVAPAVAVDLAAGLAAVGRFAAPLQWKLLLAPILAALPLIVAQAVFQVLARLGDNLVLTSVSVVVSVAQALATPLLMAIAVGLIFLKSGAREGLADPRPERKPETPVVSL
jgi:hypothetical protein